MAKTSKNPTKRSPKRGNGRLRVVSVAPYEHAVFTSNAAQLAHVFGVSSQTIAQWRRDGVPDKVAEGWDLRAWVAWRTKRLGRGQEHESPDRRLKLARARLVEMELATRRGELIPRVQADAERVGIVRLFSDTLDRVSAELCPRLPGGMAKTKRIVDPYVDEVRVRLCEETGGSPDEPDTEF